MVSPEVTRLRPEHDVAASVRQQGFGVVRGAFTDIEVSARLDETG